MTSVVTAVGRPGEEPPGEVASEILWRVAARLFRDHQPRPADSQAPPVCAGCGRPWPCSGFRMAELGLSAAMG
jgi:hypothetical protein